MRNFLDKSCREIHLKKKVKVSRYKPGVAQRVPEKITFPHFMTTAQDGGKVVSLTQLSPRKYTWYSFLLKAESTPGPYYYVTKKNAMTPSGIEPATCRFLA
jgi:hypothetical protein